MSNISAPAPASWVGRHGRPSLRLGTYNLMHTNPRTVERRALEAAEQLRDCDVTLLQEVAIAGGVNTAEIIANALGMTVAVTAGSATSSSDGTYESHTAILTALPIRTAAVNDFHDRTTGQFSSAVIFVISEAL